MAGRVADPHHSNVNPDPSFNFTANPDSYFHFNAEPDSDFSPQYGSGFCASSKSSFFISEAIVFPKDTVVFSSMFRIRIKSGQ